MLTSSSRTARPSAPRPPSVVAAPVVRSFSLWATAPRWRARLGAVTVGVSAVALPPPARQSTGEARCPPWVAAYTSRQAGRTRSTRLPAVAVGRRLGISALLYAAQRWLTTDRFPAGDPPAGAAGARGARRGLRPGHGGAHGPRRCALVWQTSTHPPRGRARGRRRPFRLRAVHALSTPPQPQPQPRSPQPPAPARAPPWCQGPGPRRPGRATAVGPAASAVFGAVPARRSRSAPCFRIPSPH
ncbi:hypothetical protein QJS66_21695 [Kocuria rhizophila]|nr:hypothetical protein QJS66_21695 [Kocuria rhizophila]